jgi:hypothetical protein
MQKLISSLPYVGAQEYQNYTGNDLTAINQVTACGLLEYVPQLLSSDGMQNYLLVTYSADNENVDNTVCDIVLQTIAVN